MNGDGLSLDDGRAVRLRVPDGAARAPVALLLQPFGAWDADAALPAEVSGNGPVRLFADLGAALAGAGCAAASFDTRFVTEDRRGGAGSPRFTFTGLVDDAVRAVELLRAHPGVDGRRVALLGVSMGAEVALAAAQRLGGEAVLVLVAPKVEAGPVFQRWLGLDRRLEWLLSGAFTGPDGSVDLAAARADLSGRSGWWEEFDLPERFGPRAEPEVLRAELAWEYDAWERGALDGSDGTAPASFWRDWYAQPAPYRRLSGLRGRVAVHVGTEDWTTPPRHAHLLHRAATAGGLESRLTVHPGLGHLLSPRTAAGLRTYGPFDPGFLRSVTASVGDLLGTPPAPAAPAAATG
ncbi:alpha/beta fold hydrolase [Kitasatospora sp. NA04385]|uniref:alpha/beta hydrolase family protein n=1 Tax=Kitasatospora sp. NA04385 TaxID=2742135 RepID=UPI00158FDA45|nr:alpha/beta hydrolase fold domain-containing protein [Kitasatospora sp. NA04385]QKW22445.1 alpha/beta fold hydrolase [Kitasatospora sp. NA04385]